VIISPIALNVLSIPQDGQVCLDPIAQCLVSFALLLDLNRPQFFTDLRSNFAMLDHFDHVSQTQSDWPHHTFAAV
jgi:hypothetical protein